MPRLSIARLPMPFALSLLAAVASSQASGAEEWLTVPERDFFQSLGHRVSVGGKPLDRTEDYLRLGVIEKKADPVLRAHIAEIKVARAMMRVKPDEEQLQRKIRKLMENQLKPQIGPAVTPMLLGREPWDADRAVPEKLLERLESAKLWDLQASWLARALKGQGLIDLNLGKFAEALEKRSGPEKPAIAPSCQVRIEKNRLKIVGKNGATPLVQPLVQSVLHRKPTGDSWAGLNFASGPTLRAMGLDKPEDKVDFGAAFHTGRLATIQELAASQPLSCFILMPDIEAGAEFSIDLGLTMAEAATIELIQLKAWTARGWFRLGEVAGIAVAKQEAIRLAREEYGAKIAEVRQRHAANSKRFDVYGKLDRVGQIINQGTNDAIRKSEMDKAGEKQRMDELWRRNLPGARP